MLGELVAGTADRQHELGEGGIVLDLVAQVADVDVDRLLVLVERLVVAEQLKQLAARIDPSRTRREMTEELKRLLECVGRLEPDRQKLVLLAYYNGWSREQLAAKFETPVNTVKTWLRRSMLEIRECLGL